jgi:cytochrome b561
MLRNERPVAVREVYTKSAVVLHIATAVSVFFLFISSWWMLGLPLPSTEYPFRAFPFQLHKNIGLTLLIVIVALLYLRFRYRPAALPDKGSLWFRAAVIANHALLYIVIIACCLSGYMSSSYSGWGTTLWWLIELPYWGRESEPLNQFWSDVHLWTCWILLGLLVLHIGGAVYHAFQNDGLLRRMLHW